MKRLFMIFMAMFIMFFVFSINAYAAPVEDGIQPVKVQLNGEFLEFDVEPTIINDRTMVPMRAIFEYFGAKVEWYGDTRTVKAYKDNDYIKLVIDNNIAYKNGKEFELDVAPTIINDRTLVPVRFVGESLGIHVDWDGDTRTVILEDTNNDDNTIEFIDDENHIVVTVDDYNLEFKLPYDWNIIDEENYEFQYVDEENNVNFNMNITELDSETTLDKFYENDKLSIYEENKNSVLFTGSNDITINDINMHVEYLKLSSLDSEINQVKYYFLINETGFTVTFTYTSNSNDSQLQEMFRDIMNTFMVREEAVDTDTEHYMEYDQFFKKGFTLESEIYSNMEAHNKVNFKGSLNEDLEYLFVQVSKDDDKVELQIPVEDKKFDANIPTPFGLGKHNIIIGTPIDENNMTHYILQFSVVNTSDDYLRYLIPTRMIESNNPEIAALAKEITKGYYSDYNKAIEILKWISANIEYDVNANTDSHTPRSAKKTYEDKKGNCDEISYLYAALLRASDIPARIASASSEGEYHAWTEIQINGKWQIVDPTWASGYINDETGEYVKEFNMDYFSVDKNEYLDRFDTEVEYLPY